MGVRSRKRSRSKQNWQEHAKAAQEEGISLAQYCRERKLSVQSLYTARYEWSRQLRQSGAAKKALGRDGEFVEVRVAPGEVPVASPVYRVQVKGCVIECATLPPTWWLRDLISGDADAVS